MRIINKKIGLILSLNAFVLPVYSESGFPACALPPVFYSKPITQHPSQDAIYIEADTGLINRRGVSSLIGKTIIQKNDWVLNADNAHFDGRTNTIMADGHIMLSTKKLQLKSDTIHFQLDSQSGQLSNVHYQLKNAASNGYSKQLIQQNGSKLILKDSLYTTCPPSLQSWNIAAKRIVLDQAKNEGSAKNVTLEVKGIPVFYFPWLSFSLNNQRKSGFLAPSAQISEQSGVSISTPYYLNLSPNYDMTISPAYLGKRGVKIDGEFRYLVNKHHGIWDYEILPRDQASNNTQRDYFKIRHTSKASDSTRFNIKAEGVSDKQYFDDFGKSLSLSSTSALERRIEAIKVGKNWHSSLAFVDYQTLDNSTRSYEKVPELKFNYTPKSLAKQVNLSFDMELTHFRKSNAPTGTRIDLNLKTHKKFGTDAIYFKPSLGLRHTYYDLKNNPTGNQHRRTLATLSIDAGFFFDQNLTGGKLVQTLEPRLFYTYTPFKDQSAFPVFDTAKTDFSTSTQLFSKNRYTGKDRIGDTNQLTIALTSRLQDRTSGKEVLQFSVGQIFHFKDRKVTLPDEQVQTNAQSDIAVELSGRLNQRTTFSTASFWNPVNHQGTAIETRLSYKDDKRSIANVTYRSLKNELKQLNTSVAYPLSQQWLMVAGIDHDLKNHRNLETLLGFEYQNCCWKTRLVGRRYLTSDNATYDDAIFLQFELKGLGNLGNKADKFLENKIYGYE